MATKPNLPVWQSTSGVIRYFYFNSSSTIIPEESPSGLSLTYTGTPTLIPDAKDFGYGAAFNTITASGSDAGLPAAATAWSVAFWFKTTISSVANVLAWGTGTHPSLLVSGGHFGVNSVIGTATVNDGIWHRVLVTYDGTNIDTYIDNAHDVSASALTLSTTLSGLTGLVLGSSGFVGSFSDIVIWSHKLSGTEITADNTDPWVYVRPTVNGYTLTANPTNGDDNHNTVITATLTNVNQSLTEAQVITLTPYIITTQPSLINLDSLNYSPARSALPGDLSVPGVGISSSIGYVTLGRFAILQDVYDILTFISYLSSDLDITLNDNGAGILGGNIVIPKGNYTSSTTYFPKSQVGTYPITATHTGGGIPSGADPSTSYTVNTLGNTEINGMFNFSSVFLNIFSIGL